MCLLGENVSKCDALAKTQGVFRNPYQRCHCLIFTYCRIFSHKVGKIMKYLMCFERMQRRGIPSKITVTFISIFEGCGSIGLLISKKKLTTRLWQEAYSKLVPAGYTMFWCICMYSCTPNVVTSQRQKALYLEHNHWRVLSYLSRARFISIGLFVKETT